MDENADTTKEKQDKQPWLKEYRWPKGVSGNPDGRPTGKLSPTDKIRQMFRENPGDFEDFLNNYLSDRSNHKHVVEMLDGKPRQGMDLDVTLPQTLVELITHGVTNKPTDTGIPE